MVEFAKQSVYSAFYKTWTEALNHKMHVKSLDLRKISENSEK